jgi:uncharacterized protein (DUF427 family)
MQAIWHGTVIADSDKTIEKQGYVYFPRAAVRMDMLAKAPKIASDHHCPHGVQFYDLAHAGAESLRAAWSYESPLEAMKPVDHWIGFWKDVVLK